MLVPLKHFSACREEQRHIYSALLSSAYQEPDSCKNRTIQNSHNYFNGQPWSQSMQTWRCRGFLWPFVELTSVEASVVSEAASAVKTKMKRFLLLSPSSYMAKWAKKRERNLLNEVTNCGSLVDYATWHPNSRLKTGASSNATLEVRLCALCRFS